MFEVTELPIESISVIDRVRKDLGDIASLASDIEKVGLLYPILVNEKYRLLEGERRLTAYKHLGRTTIPVRVLPGVADDDAMVIELMGNASREPFKWHEELEIKHRLHNYWKMQSPANWGYRETASKMQVSLGGLSSDLELFSAIKLFPDLKDCETKGKARETYKKFVSQAQAHVALESLPDDQKASILKMMSGKADITAPLFKAKNPDSCPEFSTVSAGCSEMNKINAESNAVGPVDPLDKLPAHAYAIESWQTFIAKIPDNSVGFVELDPPYAIDFNTNYGKLNDIESKATDWTVDQLKDCFRLMLPILYDKMLDDSWVLCWTGKEHVEWINAGASQCGFKVQAPGIWAKNGGSSNSPKTNMISCYEMFLLLRKGNATFNVPSMHNVISFNPPAATNRIHQWEKPLEMYSFFQTALGRPNTIFLTPFAGSGNSMIAAALAGMMPFGCDVNQQYVLEFYQRFQAHYK